MLNRRASLDPRWTKHFYKPTVGFMTAHIEILRLDKTIDPIYNPETRTYEYTSETVFNGMARAQPFGIFGNMNVGQDTTGRRLMRFQVISKDTGVNIDDQINILEAEGELEFFNYDVRSTVTSSNPWLSDFVAEADLKGNFSE